MLRGLSSYYYKEPTLLFLVRVAQGLVHMGKGLLNLAPKHADSNLISGEPTQPNPTVVDLSGLAFDQAMRARIDAQSCGSRMSNSRLAPLHWAKMPPSRA